MKHVADPIPLAPANDVPEPLFRAVLKCLAKKADDRWPHATDFAKALEAGLTAGPAVGPTTALPTAPGPTTILPTTPSGPAARAGGTSTVVPPPRTPRPSPSSLPAASASGGTSSALPLILGLAFLALIVLAVGSGGLWWFLRSRDTTTDAGYTPPPDREPSTTQAPAVTAAPTEPGADVQPGAPTEGATLPPAAVTRRADEARTTTAPAAPTSAPAAAAATSAPAAAGHAAPSLEVDLEVVQDAGGPWALSSVLFARLRVDEKVVKDLRLDFGGTARIRQHVQVPNIVPGVHEVGVAVSKSQDMVDEASIAGGKDLSLTDGVNPVGIQVRFTGPEDWTIKFR
jgi:hypothetical protein